MSSNRTRRRSAADVALLALEFLEQRALFSAPYDFMGAGIRYDAMGGPQVYIADGTIAADDSITGTMQFATLAAVGPQQAIDWTSYNRAPHGQFTFGTRGGFTAYDSQSGSQFIDEERFALGTFVGRAADGSPRDYAVLTQNVYADSTFEEFREAMGAGYQMQMIRLTDQGTLESFSLDIVTDFGNPAPDLSLTFVYHLASGDVTSVRQVDSYAGGRLTLDDGEVLVINGRRDGAVLADLDNTDGIVGIASGRSVTGALQNGRYGGDIVISGPLAAAFVGVDPASIGPSGTAVASVVIQLDLHSLPPDDAVNQNNTFSIYRRDEFDAGMRTPVATGHWTVSDELSDEFGFTYPRIDLVTDDGLHVSVHGAASHVLIMSDISGPADGHEELFGAVSGAALLTDNVVDFQADVDANGHPIAFLDVRGTDDLFTPASYSIDLLDEVGGSAVVGQLVSWGNVLEHHFWAGLSSTGDVQVWSFSSQYGWTYANLTTGVTNARPIVSDLFFTQSNSDRYLNGQDPQFLSGFDSDGNFIVYRQVSPGFLDPTWAFVDAEADGFGDGATRPQFTTGLSGWGSNWGAGHFAGLDASGDLWSIWWAPSLDKWEVSNLTQEASTPALVGEVSVVRTDWDTFHIHGTDSSGNLIVTWWGASLGHWEARNLTTELGGPTLAANSLTSNFSSGLQNMNIVGLDTDGQARIYWWNLNLGWHINSLTAGLDPGMIPLGPWQMTSASWFTFTPTFNTQYSQSLLGHNQDGDRVRLIWSTTEPDMWELQNLTMVSLPYFP